MCANDRVIETVLRTRVGTAAGVCTWRSFELLRLSADICSTEQNSEHEHEQGLACSDSCMFII